MRPVERLGMFRGSTGRAAYLVGWTKPLRRARGVRGEVGGGNRTQHSESRHPAGVLGGLACPVVAGGEPVRGPWGLGVAVATSRGRGRVRPFQRWEGAAVEAEAGGICLARSS